MSLQFLRPLFADPNRTPNGGCRQFTEEYVCNVKNGEQSGLSFEQVEPNCSLGCSRHLGLTTALIAQMACTGAPHRRAQDSEWYWIAGRQMPISWQLACGHSIEAKIASVMDLPRVPRTVTIRAKLGTSPRVEFGHAHFEKFSSLSSDNLSFCKL